MNSTMKTARPAWVAAILGAAMLVGCGGGGGGGTAAPAGTTTTNPTTTPTTTAPARITVSTVPAPTATASDCPKLTDDAQAIAALDLSNPSVKAVHDEVQAVDSTHAFKVFIRQPGQFVNWIVTAGGTVDVETLGVATHETSHQLNAALKVCAPRAADLVAKYFFFGSELVTDLRTGDTDHISIVDETIATPLKSASRYSTYITGVGGAGGNDFRIVLDELAAYVGAAHTEQLYIASGKAAGDNRMLDINLGGTVNFMVYLQNYLMSARLNHPATYAAISGSPATVAAIQAIWSRSETVLRDSYSLTQASSTPQLIVSRDYFDAAYSPALLAELDAIGVTHATRASWTSSYLQ